MIQKILSKEKTILIFEALFVQTLIIITAAFLLNSKTNFLYRAKAAISPSKPSLLITDVGFRKGTTIIDFSQVSCCKILSDEYQSSRGVVFDNDLSKGWGTYQANDFANNLSTASTWPGAPAGATGTRIILNKNTRRVGAYIQAGTPFDPTSTHPGKSITIKAYDNQKNKIFEQTVNTCLGQDSDCTRKFIGISSTGPDIRIIEYILNESYSLSIDNLKWESK